VLVLESPADRDTTGEHAGVVQLGASGVRGHRDGDGAAGRRGADAGLSLAVGKRARSQAPLDAHRGWGPASDRPDPVALLEAQDATRAPDLAVMLGREPVDFKRDVRKLKELGLTESLPVGYRLSPRGEALLKALGPPPAAAKRSR